MQTHRDPTPSMRPADLAVPLATFGESGGLQAKGAETLDSGTYSLVAWLGARRRRLIVRYDYTIPRSISHETFVHIGPFIINLRPLLVSNLRNHY
jgi:hypothetical protein